MAFSNIIHESDHYTSSIAAAHNTAGAVFFAMVINPPGGIDTQYCVIKRIDPNTGENKEVQRIYARDSRAVLLSEGADPLLTNGKYGNVAIAIVDDDIIIGLEMRYNNVNKQRWGILRGKGI